MGFSHRTHGQHVSPQIFLGDTRSFICQLPQCCLWCRGRASLDEEQALFIKTEIEKLSKLTKEGHTGHTGEDTHQILSKFRLNVETPDDGGRDGFIEFPGSPTIVVQADGEVQIKSEEGILLTADGKF